MKTTSYTERYTLRPSPPSSNRAQNQRSTPVNARFSLGGEGDRGLARRSPIDGFCAAENYYKGGISNGCC